MGLESLPSSFSSSFTSSGATAPPAAGAPPDATAAAPPPEPTFRRRSFTSLPSSACGHISRRYFEIIFLDVVLTLAKRVVHIGSTSGTLAAEMRVCSLSAFAERQHRINRRLIPFRALSRV
jgi:hypothetical protein